jgi:hypothetical protein
MTGNWVAVASADHVRRGLASGIMQVCHGKVSPLRRIEPGDRIAYYSPTIAFRGKAKCQAFTALGIVGDGEPYQVEMAESFCPFRRDVNWLPTRSAPIAPLLETLDFASGKRNWGYQLRFGFFAVSDHDMRVIAAAMGVEQLAMPGDETLSAHWGERVRATASG